MDRSTGEPSTLRKAYARFGEGRTEKYPSRQLAGRLLYFILGVIGSKADAEYLMEQVKTFLTQELNLEMNEEKTKIRHIEDGCNFLGYDVRQVKSEKVMKGEHHGRTSKRRTTSAVVSLYVPKDVPGEFCHKHDYGDYQNMRSLHRPYLLELSVPEIIATYNAELRGLTEYYALACDVKQKLPKLFYMAHYSLFKTIARKHKGQSMKETIGRMAEGSEFVFRYKVGDREYGIRVYKLKHLNLKGKEWQVDNVPNTAHLTTSRTEVVERLNADKCEYCGEEIAGEVHHVRKLKDLKQKREKSLAERMMIARARKTLVLCTDCHNRLHDGTLPDTRHVRC